MAEKDYRHKKFMRGEIEVEPVYFYPQPGGGKGKQQIDHSGKSKGKGKGKEKKGKGQGSDSKGKSKGDERSSGKGAVDMKKIQCYLCKKFGHYARDCWTSGEGRAKYQPNCMRCDSVTGPHIESSIVWHVVHNGRNTFGDHVVRWRR